MSAPSQASSVTPSLEQLLTRTRQPGAKRHRAWLAAALLAVVGAAVVALSIRSAERAAAPRYRTEDAARGTLSVQVSATGNLEPTNQVEVGSELSGIVEAVYVDDNDRVKKGQVLAQLDPSKLKDAVTQASANLAAAEAQVLQARATLTESAANLSRLEQVAELSHGKVPSKSEMDSARASLERAKANEASARASVAQARATLQSNETNLQKASIRSPIDGMVLERKVEPGQTVAAAYQAPVLFTLAEDLSKMDLQVDVDEADVGQVKVGQRATFTVDAWPDRRYEAVITRVGYGSRVTDGVVSYLTVLHVDNSDLSLRPGMTGTAEITTLTHDGALLVPSAALRFSPPAQRQPEPAATRSPLTTLMPRMPQVSLKASTSAPSAGSAQRVWVLRDGAAQPVEVTVGASNGQWTEITGGDLQPGVPVITEALGATS